MSRRDVVGLLISAVSLAAVVWWALEQKSPTFPTSSLYALVTAIRGWRWHVVLRLSGIEHARADPYALTTVGYMGNTVLPARGGEILRILLLGERTGARRREILGSIVAERALDVVALIVLFAVITWVQVAGAPVGQVPALVALALVAAGVLVLAYYFRLRRRGSLERFASIVRPFLRASRLLAGRTGLPLFAVTIALWLLEGAIFWLVGLSLEVDVGFLEAVFLVVLTSFFLSIPAAPGYLGTFDAALLFGLRALDIQGGEAVAFVLLVRFVLFVPITAAGLLVMLTRYGGLSRMFGSTIRADEAGEARRGVAPSVGHSPPS
jgi:glycosyltransferase 2 family protein